MPISAMSKHNVTINKTKKNNSNYRILTTVVILQVGNTVVQKS